MDVKGSAYKYQPVDNGFRIFNGKGLFNKHLFGSHEKGPQQHERFFTYAGDLPLFTGAIVGRVGNMQHAKCGTLFLGAAYAPGALPPGYSSWLQEFDSIEATYLNGWMKYTLRTAKETPFLPVEIGMETYPLQGSEGFLVSLKISKVWQPFHLVIAYGGLTGYLPERLELSAKKAPFKPSDCQNNEVSFNQNMVHIKGADPEVKTEMWMSTSFPVELFVGDASDIENGPGAMLTSKVKDAPVAVAHCLVEPERDRPSFFGRIFVIRSQDPKELEHWLSMQNPEEFLKREIRRVQSILRVKTPDPYLNTAVPVQVTTIDACWHHPTFRHGTVSYHYPYLGWRNWYGPTVIGWHDRVRTAIMAHAGSQLKGPEDAQLTMDSVGAFWRGAETRGGIPDRLVPNYRGIFYNMMEVYIDHVLYQLAWTGDWNFARQVFPVIKGVLEWEKKWLDSDGDGLYENYLNTWGSDAHGYNGGGCIQSSAYNYRANRAMAEIAEKTGEDPKPFHERAEKVKAACMRRLWIQERGIFAEYVDTLGNGLLHPAPEIASIYIPIDEGLCDPFMAYQMLRYTETDIPSEYSSPEGGRISWNSNWLPPFYSSCGLYPAENLHLALCYYKMGLADRADEILRAIVASLYRGPDPGSLTHMLSPDGVHTGCQGFADTVSMFLRTLVEGLFGVTFDLLHDKATFQPALPRRWKEARLEIPDATVTYKREKTKEHYLFKAQKQCTKQIRIPLRCSSIVSVKVNGNKADFKVEPGIGNSYLTLETKDPSNTITIEYRDTPLPNLRYPSKVAKSTHIECKASRGEILEVIDPQKVLENPKIEKNLLEARVVGSPGHHTFFVKLRYMDAVLFSPIDVKVEHTVMVQMADSKDRLAVTLSNNGEADLDALVNVNTVAKRSVRLPKGVSKTLTFSKRESGSDLPGIQTVKVFSKDGTTFFGEAKKAMQIARTLPEISFHMVDLQPFFNAETESLHDQKYLNPRPKTYSIMCQFNGRFGWDLTPFGGRARYPQKVFVDVSKLRRANGVYWSRCGVPFKTPSEGKNFVAVSLWEKFPEAITIPIQRRGRRIFFLFMGVTNQMQSRIVNATISLKMDKGSGSLLQLVNPDNFDDWLAPPYNLEALNEYVGLGTHLLVVDAPLNPNIELESVEIKAIANQVILGLLGITLVV